MFTTALTAALSLGVIGLVLELFGASMRMRLVRRSAYLGAMIFTCLAAPLLLVDVSLPGLLVFLIAIYRVFNHFRVLSGRMHERRAYIVTRRTSYVLVGLQLVSFLAWYLHDREPINAQTWLLILTAMSLLCSVVLFVSTLRNLKKSSLRPSDKYRSLDDLPAVSVCVPARNETADLPACLESILTSDYPKLEILVLDDCSHDKTSEVIKSFAQRGVRFLKGEPPKRSWLAKNQAYAQLAEAASGQLLLFAGVDTRFDAKTIRHLVGTLLARNKDMISVMPHGVQTDDQAGLLQPMRYWWELALPRRLFNRPPVLSTCWMIKKDALKAHGGFRAVNNTVVPESYFARELAIKDTYSFMRASQKLPLTSTKQFDQQWETAVRVRYPQLRKRPEAVLLLFVGELAVLLFPLGLFITGFFVDIGMSWILAGLQVMLLASVHYLILKAWNIKNIPLQLAALPAAVVMEMVVLHVSMWRYEFSEVAWKERNICIPVMHVIPRLPKV